MDNTPKVGDIMTKTCTMCGAEFQVAFPASERAKFCVDCRKIANRERLRVFRQQHKTKKAEEKSAEQRKRAEQSAHELSQVAREALEAGLSYGQYVAKKGVVSMSDKDKQETKPGIVRQLITQALEALEGLDGKEAGNAIGLLTAAKMILEGK